MIFTPTTPEQVDTAADLLLNAKGTRGNIKTKIFVPNNNYTIAMLCQEGQPPEFPLSGRTLDTKNLESINAITSASESSIQEIYDAKKKCNAKPSSLLEIFTRINNAANQKQYGKIIIFLQLPWSKEELNESQQEKSLQQVKISVDNLSKTQQVEQVILFGVNTTTPALLSSTFQSLNGKIITNTSKSLNEQSLQQVNKKLKSY